MSIYNLLTFSQLYYYLIPSFFPLPSSLPKTQNNPFSLQYVIKQKPTPEDISTTDAKQQGRCERQEQKYNAQADRQICSLTKLIKSSIICKIAHITVHGSVDPGLNKLLPVEQGVLISSEISALPYIRTDSSNN